MTTREKERAIIELKLVTSVLLSFHDQILAKLHDLRRKENLCIECGKRPPDEDDYCDPCYKKAMREKLDELQHPDEGR
jgi:hypothetical protein